MSCSGSISESLCWYASVLSFGVSLGLSLEIEIASIEHGISILYTLIGKASRASLANHQLPETRVSVERVSLGRVHYGDGARPGDIIELRQLHLIGFVCYSSSLENLESGGGASLEFDLG